MSILRPVLLSLVVASRALAAEGISGHLVPTDPYSTPSYRKLYEKKLFVTPGDAARFVYLPGAVDPEMVISVYSRRAQSGQPATYWVTLTKPSARLWLCIHTGDEQFTGRKDLDPKTVRTLKADALLPVSTVRAIHNLWLAMLEQTAPDPCVDCLLVDGYTEIFSAVDSHGKLRRAQMPTSPSKQLRCLVDLGFGLADYVNRAPAERPQIAHKIERAAAALQNHVTHR